VVSTQSSRIPLNLDQNHTLVNERVVDRADIPLDERMDVKLKRQRNDKGKGGIKRYKVVVAHQNRQIGCDPSLP